MVYRAVSLKRILQHREWMIRSYVITFAIVLFRFLDQRTITEELMKNFVERGSTCIWLSWAVPLFIAEVLLQRNKKK